MDSVWKEIFDCESCLEALKRLANGDGQLKERVVENPGIFLKLLHVEWIQNGGKISGKPRHSARQLRDLIRGDKIKSLEQKLRGATRLIQNDAIVLLETLFDNWRYDGAKGSYEPIELLQGRKERIELISPMFQRERYITLSLDNKISNEPNREKYFERKTESNIKLITSNNSIEIDESDDEVSWRINQAERFPELVANLGNSLSETIESVNLMEDILGNMARAQLISILEQGIKEINSPLINRDSMEDKKSFLSSIRVAVQEKVYKGYEITDKIAKFLINIDKAIKLLSEFIVRTFS